MLFQAVLHMEDMKKIKISTTIAISFVSLLIFYILNILLLFFLVHIAYTISKSYTNKIGKTSQGANTSLYIQSWEIPEPSWSFSCDTAHFEYDICYLNRQLRLDPMNGIVSIVDPTGSTPPSMTWIRPYPRKGHVDPMRRTKEVTLTTAPLDEPCTVTHHRPILIFSTGGFTGNTFHDFNEGWVPLFVTVYEFFKDRDVVLGIYNCKNWWLAKYAELLPYFTRYPVINLDKEKGIHCFPYGIVGLKSHGVMEVDPALFGQNPKTMLDFRAIFGQAYRPGRINANMILPTFSSNGKPKLAFMVRRDTRKVINGNKVVLLAENLGFEVVAFEINKNTLMREIFRLIDSSHALMGIHGSGLTHVLFLRPGAVFVQIIPINCGWLGDMCYGKVARRLGIYHISYEIEFNESSIRTDDFARNAILDRINPASSMMGNIDIWNKYMNQDVEIDLVRFRGYLQRAYDKARNFMLKQG